MPVCCAGRSCPEACVRPLDQAMGSQGRDRVFSLILRLQLLSLLAIEPWNVVTAKVIALPVPENYILVRSSEGKLEMSDTANTKELLTLTTEIVAAHVSKN